MQEGGGAGKKVMIRHNPSLASHTLHRDDGFGHTATIELSPRQKLVTNEINTLHKLHLLSWSSNLIGHNVFSRFQHLII